MEEEKKRAEEEEREKVEEQKRALEEAEKQKAEQQRKRMEEEKRSREEEEKRKAEQEAQMYAALAEKTGLHVRFEVRWPVISRCSNYSFYTKVLHPDGRKDEIIYLDKRDRARRYDKTKNIPPGRYQIESKLTCWEPASAMDSVQAFFRSAYSIREVWRDRKDFDFDLPLGETVHLGITIENDVIRIYQEK